MYRQGLYPETPEGLTKRKFHDKIREWVRVEDACGSEALMHKNFNTIWTADKRYELVAQVLAGNSCREVAFSNGINPGQLYQWVRKYKELGYNGLESLKKGRPIKEPEMKKNVEPRPLSESEREELIRLRAEVEYMKAENKSETFLGKFFNATIAQKSMVTQRIYESGNMLAGYSLTPDPIELTAKTVENSIKAGDRND